MKNLRNKCACSAAGIGICLCTVFMTISMVGATVVGISKNTSAMSNMNNVPPSSSPILQNVFVVFFSGFWGEVILLVSFAVMLYGMLSSGGSRKKLVPFSAFGAVILYVSMYAYFSLPLEIVGSIILAVAYASVYSCRVAAAIRLA